MSYHERMVSTSREQTTASGGQASAPREQTSALIAVSPGVMRDSLLAFLRATLHVEIAALIDDAAVIQKSVCQHQPRTLVVDADLCQGTLLNIVRQLSTESPALNSVVLVDSFRQQRIFLAAGARHVLLKGCLDERLRAAVLDTS